jgi:hypothetical protein
MDVKQLVPLYAARTVDRTGRSTLRISVISLAEAQNKRFELSGFRAFCREDLTSFSLLFEVDHYYLSV